MIPPPKLTNEVLMRFVNSGNWGSFPSVRVDLGEEGAGSPEDGFVFVERDTLSADVSIKPSEEWSNFRGINIYLRPSIVSLRVGLRLYFGKSVSVKPFLGKCQGPVYKIAIRDLSWLDELLKIALQELGPFESILTAVDNRDWHPADGTPLDRYQHYVEHVKESVVKLANGYGYMHPIQRFRSEMDAATWHRGESVLSKYGADELISPVGKNLGILPGQSGCEVASESLGHGSPVCKRMGKEWTDQELKSWFDTCEWNCEDCGGPVDLAFFDDEEVPSFGVFRSKPELEGSGLWWWRKIGNWGNATREMFRANWARSALLYEFRARLNGRPRFWPFGVPWAWLGQRERASLYFLWPQFVQGERFSFGRNTLTPPEYVHNDHAPQVSVDSGWPLKTIRKHLSEMRSAFRADLKRAGLGFAPVPDREESYDWVLLEKMDCHAYLNSKMSNKFSQRKVQMNKRYRTACDDVRIL